MRHRQNDARRKLIDPKKALAGLLPGIATGDAIDGAGDASGKLLPRVAAMYEEVTTTDRLEKLEAENVALKEQLAAARAALDPDSSNKKQDASGGVSASGASGHSTSAYPEPIDDDGMPLPQLRPDPLPGEVQLHLYYALARQQPCIHGPALLRLHS